jgi:MFS family permease
MQQLLLLSAAIFGVAFGRASLGPLQEAMRVNLALSDYQIALMQGPALAIPMALGAIPLGFLVNRVPRARLLLLFVGVCLAASLLSVFASSLPTLFVGRCLIGLAIAAVTVTAYSMVADLFAPAQRGRATMAVALGEVGGAPAAFALGGVLLEMSLSDSLFGLAPWRSALLILSVVLLPIVFLMKWVREPPRTQVTTNLSSSRALWAQLWEYRLLLGPLLFARILMWVADGAVLVWAAPSFSRRFNLSPDMIGTMMGSALFVSGLLGPLLGGPLADICQRTGGPRRTVLALMFLALLSAPAALFALAPSPAFAGFLLAVFLTLGYMLGTAALTLGTIVIPGELRGVYLALSVTIGALFFVGVAPLVISSLSDLLGGEAMLGEALAIACAVASLMGALILAFTRHYFPDSSSFTTRPGAWAAER